MKEFEGFLEKSKRGSSAGGLWKTFIDNKFKRYRIKS